ncbi:MAG TPA: NUDIX hydrolase [Thermohalobaculum sp.]|nr:NUDIX hydrolase [Thermohalobaculum sp.]
MTPPETAPETRPKDALRDAATVILVRRAAGVPRLLMGQRGRGAAFMASKFVFPGGAIDAADASIPAARPLAPRTEARLGLRAAPGIARALAMAAIRELWEETGLALAVADGPVPGTPVPGWRGFFAAGHRPAADGLEFVFRAVTPAGRPRRFDARFFMADAERLACDPDDFAGAEGELAHLRWITLAEARALDLPFITEVALAEVESRLSEPDATRPVPFFRHGAGRSFVDPL